MPKMHTDEVELSLSNLRGMLCEQFPEFDKLPLVKLESFGTVNEIYRLGEKYSVRLPRRMSGVYQLKKEKEWLHKLKEYLPLEIPTQILMGEPNDEFPFNWGIYKWIEGENLNLEKLNNINENVQILSSFIKALQKVDLENGPNPGIHNYHRGEALKNRDKQTQETINSLKGKINSKIAEEIWNEALSYEMKSTDKSWIHGDLQSGNILMKNGKISSVIDFGAFGYGDIACDLMVAWNFLDSSSRKEFQRLMSVEDKVWKRARGWALSVALIAYEYYEKTNLSLARISKYTIDEIENEYRC